MPEVVKKYRPSDSEVERFHDSDAQVRGIRGPFGSGKSVACFWEIFFRAQDMPAQADGVRRSRWAVVRNTYPELLTTSLNTFKDWFGGISTVREAAPIQAVLRGVIPTDNTKVELQIYFLALDRPEDVKKLLSLELTGCFLNEARELPYAILTAARGRVGRYPSKNDLSEPYWSGVIMDTNPPDDDHWWYKKAEEEKPDGFVFFSQVPALIKTSEGQYIGNPDAEYVKIQSKGVNYWLDLVPGSTQEWINVYVLGQYGTIMDGRPVFPEYLDSRHFAGDLEWYKGLPLILGWDFGLTPSCVFMQCTAKGQIRVLDELVSDSMGIRQFSTQVVKPHLSAHYPGADIQSYGDPAGVQRAQTDEKTCMDELRAAGLETMPAATNEFLARREAVATPMLHTIDNEPGFVISSKCKILRRGFLGGYKYERLQVRGEERYKDLPCKNSYSHPQDALQYGALSVDRPRVAARAKRVNFIPAKW